MKKTILLLVISVMIFCAACGAQPQQSTSPSASPSASASAEPSPSPSATPSPSESASPSAPALPENVSFTTGLPLEGATYKPVAVMIENSPAARPQNGLQAADIVYEAIAEGGITRFLCLFNDHMPTTVGPVRSLRLYYLQIQEEWDSILVHFGGPMTRGLESDVFHTASAKLKLRVCGIKGIVYNNDLDHAKSSGAYFWRSTDRKAPHNAYTNLEKVQALYDYTPNARTPWQFDANTALCAKRCAGDQGEPAVRLKQLVPVVYLR